MKLNIYLVSKHLIMHTYKFMLIFHTSTKILSKILLHVKMQKTHEVFSHSSINTSLTEAVLNWLSFCFATAARRLFHRKIHVAFYMLFGSLWSSISSHFCVIAFFMVQVWWLFMQDSASCNTHRARTTQDDLRNVVPDFAVEKTSCSTSAVHKTGWVFIQHIFRWKLVKAADKLVFFDILLHIFW